MKRIIHCFILLVQLFISCKKKAGAEPDFSNSDKYSFSLIKTCVDITLTTKQQMNTKNYVVDLSGYESLGLNKKGVDSFIAKKNAVLPTTYDDSVIMNVGNEAYMQQSMLINFKKITRKENGVVTVEMQKFKSGKEKVDILIELSRKEDGYFFISSKEIRDTL